jgi:hypothetical protein
MLLCLIRVHPRRSAAKTVFPPKAKGQRGLAFALCEPGNYFLGEGAMASLVAFATRNFTTVLALI